VVRSRRFHVWGLIAVAGLVLSYWAGPHVDVCWYMCLIGLGTSRFGHSWFLLSNAVKRSASDPLWAAFGLFFLPFFLWVAGCGGGGMALVFSEGILVELRG
jgi:hypothetical protein